jgi:CubicO group peptidase (beta-lactamase class C family)
MEAEAKHRVARARIEAGEVAVQDPLEAIGRVLDRHTGSGPGKLFPGCAAVVASAGRILLHSYRGHAQVHDRGRALEVPKPVEPVTLFDVASLTKVCATTMAAMILVSEGRLDVDQPVRAWVPEFGGPGKDAITLRHLLSHRAGLWEWWPLYIGTGTPLEALLKLVGLPLRYPVNASRHYSDLGMILAGEVVARAAGEALDTFATRRIFEPLSMSDTCFTPPGELRHRVAATSTGNPHERHMLATGDPYPTGERAEDFDGWRTHTLVGEANDGNAHHAFNGVAGHAGVFSTATDLAALGQALLLALDGDDALVDPAVLRRFLSEVEPGQGLGFWTDRLGELAVGTGGFGHSGFTGCELFVDDRRDLVVILVTNRSHHPWPYPDIRPAWRELLEAATSIVDD